MTHLSKTRRGVLALGGFLLFTGFILVGVLILVSLNILDLSDVLMSPQYRVLSMVVLLIVGVLDLVSAVALIR